MGRIQPETHRCLLDGCTLYFPIHRTVEELYNWGGEGSWVRGKGVGVKVWDLELVSTPRQYGDPFTTSDDHLKFSF
jgi:hypothetical protein